MFNRVRSQEQTKVKAIIKRAVSLARVPGEAQSRGSGANAYSAMKSPLIEAPADGGEVGFHHGESGVDADGNQFFPLLLDIDSTDSEAYLV